MQSIPKPGRIVQLTAVAGCCLLFIADRASGDKVQESFEITVPHPPAVVTVEGHQRIVFETHLTNFTHQRLYLSEVQISVDRRPLANYKGQDLLARLAPIVQGVPSATLAPGGRVILYAEIDLPVGPAPRTLEQVITYRGEGAAQESIVVPSPARIARIAPVAFGAPLRGGPWVAIYKAEWPRGHRRVFYTAGGRTRLPGRFAIDWVKVDTHGHIADGDPDQVAAHIGYGAEVLAVADAIVAAVRDGVPEATRVSANPDHPISAAAGNFVSLRLADGNYVLYEHLKPGTLRVGAGDRVRKGQVIGALGFTGDTTGPHLHLHVADAAIPLEGEGLPYALSSFTLLGRYDEIGDLGTRPWRGAAPTLRHDETPGSNVVIMFEH